MKKRNTIEIGLSNKFRNNIKDSHEYDIILSDNSADTRDVDIKVSSDKHKSGINTKTNLDATISSTYSKAKTLTKTKIHNTSLKILAGSFAIILVGIINEISFKLGKTGKLLSLNP